MPVVDSEWKIETTSRIGNYRGSYLAYDMLFQPISSDNEDKEGDNLTGNCLVSIQNLTKKEKIIV